MTDEATYIPRRGDDREARLKEDRDRHLRGSKAWDHFNRLLNRHRECSDYGIPLDDDGGDP